MIERERLSALIDYVEATERDRLRTVSDMAEYRGFRRAGEDVLKLPGVQVNVVEGEDSIWLRVERLVRRPPPPSTDAGLRAWMDAPDDVEATPRLRAEIKRTAGEDGTADRDAADRGRTGTLRLVDHPARAQLDQALAAYVREIWSPWVLDERPRRRTIALYNGLFALRQALEGGSEQPVELVWGIGIARWKRPLGSLHHPLLTIPVELTLDEKSHAIAVRPRSEAPPMIEAAPLDALEVSAVDEWRRGTQRFLDGLEGEGLSPFAPESFAPVLRRAVALLDPDGHYLPDLGERRAPEGEALRVDDHWVLIERSRQATQLMDDLHRFRDRIGKVEALDDLPGAVRVLLEPPAAETGAESFPSYRGVSTVPGVTTSDGSGADLFFPMPFNREQVQVIQRLATRPGVVVQGPPGTGKTHTIANIISHYLASGKRVLVTSQKAPALKVLRDKLPAAVRPLAVSLLDSDRDGLKQFQESVDIIADRLHRTRPTEVRAQIAALDARIDALHRGLARIDREVEDIGRAAMTERSIDGVPVAPAEAARPLVAAGSLAQWLPDAVDAIASHEPEFDDETIARLRRARQEAGERLPWMQVAPPPADLPGADEIVAVHHDLLEAGALAQAVSMQALAPGVTSEAVAVLRDRVERLKATQEGCATLAFAWWREVLQRLRLDAEDASLAAIAGLASEIAAAGEEARHFLTRPVELPAEAAAAAAFREALARLAGGEDFGLFHSLFARHLKAQIAAVRFAGHPPRSAEDWSEIVRYLAALDAAGRLAAVWNHAAAHAGLEPTLAEGLATAEPMRRQLDQVARLRALVAEESAASLAMAAAVPAWHKHFHGDAIALAQAADLLGSHERLLRLASAKTSLFAVQRQVRDVEGEIGAELRALADDHIGTAGTDAPVLRLRWQKALDQARELRALAPTFAAIRHGTGLIEESGAPLWADRLRSEPVRGSEDPLTPGDWRERWTLRRLATWLARIDAHDRLRALGQERGDHEGRLRRAYEESVELRTWCGLAEKASDQVRSALAAYAQAMRRIGRGTGVRAGRYRLDARAAADRAKNALPCWIMPHYRVSESLPADLGLFDLVIVDEASQSTVAALPALLRAKQVLIVGDDRQVSPDAGFREEARMNQLADRHLGTQVADYRAALREEKSLYDLGTVVFAGGAILLKEHFRCVAPIIEYSKAQFYSHQLEPLRLPSASERLDPPLIDILVEDGFRKGKVNPPEVDFIVDAIGRIVDDPAMAARSIGVTTLLGQEQAVAILGAIEQVIGPEAVQRHQIRVGEPAAFQGDERDIMFLSLVADRSSSGLSGLAYEQRFNVAASRARDRMVLVRSVEIEDLRPSDKLRRALIDHFHAPFAAEGVLAGERRARCESPFELEMYDLLVERGYRVDTQVAVGSKRIDMVVEGADDRRLAIECDGDRYHGPAQWPDDMARQRMLERAGWTVWRCFASRFVRERDAVIAELVGVLAARGIHPETGEALPPSRHTEHRRWRSTPLDSEPVPYAWLVPADPV